MQHTNNTKPHNSTGQQILSYTAQLIQIEAILHIREDELHRNLNKTQNCKSSSVLENFRRDAPICTYDFVLQWKLHLVVKLDSNLTSHLMEVTMAQGRLHIEAKKKELLYILKIIIRKILTTLSFFRPNIIKLCTKFDNNFGCRLSYSSAYYIFIRLLDVNFDKFTFSF